MTDIELAREIAARRERAAVVAFIRADIADMLADADAAMFAHERIYAAGLAERIEAGEHVAGVKQCLTTEPVRDAYTLPGAGTVRESLTVAIAIERGDHAPTTGGGDA